MRDASMGSERFALMGAATTPRGCERSMVKQLHSRPASLVQEVRSNRFHIITTNASDRRPLQIQTRVR